MESSDIRPLFNISEDSNSQMFNILLRIKDIAINIVKEQIGDMKYISMKDILLRV